MTGRTFCTPYYAVIFSALRTVANEGYDDTARRMVELAQAQPGFLGMESARGADGFGITVSYWQSEEAILAWKHESEHRAAQARGRKSWYQTFDVRVAKIERAYSFAAAQTLAR